MKKCQTDSATACDTAAGDKKLAGAAKTASPRSALPTRSDNRATAGHYRIRPSVDWMRGTPDQAAALMKPYPGAVEAWEVGADVGNVRNNGPELMDRVGHF